jgi:Putative beta-barrel porin 2
LRKITVSNLTTVGLPLCGLAWSALAFGAVEIPDPKDTLDRAVAGPDLIGGTGDHAFSVYAADREQFDSNVYRLPNGSDVAAVVGPSATTHDHINSPGAGLEGQWGFGRQIINLQVNAQDNLYANNANLNNVSSKDRLIWNWGLGGVLSGQVGIDYLRGLAGFVNAVSYTRNIYQQANYFAATRIQVGPRWAIYGGIENSALGFGQSASRGNNSGSKSVDMGFDFVTNIEDTIGLDYRYTDTRYANGVALSNTVFAPDYRDERLRLLLKRVLSEKTSIDLTAGYLKRTYGNNLIGSFKGPIWSGTLGWQPTDKTQLLASTWRNLRAYLTDQSYYYRSTGVSLSPVWNATEKINFSFLVSRESQIYIGSSPMGGGQPGRRDTVNAQVASITYTPIHALILDFSYRHEQRDSNVQLRTYTDGLASAGVKFMF